MRAQFLEPRDGRTKRRGVVRVAVVWGFLRVGHEAAGCVMTGVRPRRTSSGWGRMLTTSDNDDDIMMLGPEMKRTKTRTFTLLEVLIVISGCTWCHLHQGLFVSFVGVGWANEQNYDQLVESRCGGRGVSSGAILFTLRLFPS